MLIRSELRNIYISFPLLCIFRKTNIYLYFHFSINILVPFPYFHFRTCFYFTKFVSRYYLVRKTPLKSTNKNNKCTFCKFITFTSTRETSVVVVVVVVVCVIFSLLVFYSDHMGGCEFHHQVNNIYIIVRCKRFSVLCYRSNKMTR